MLENLAIYLWIGIAVLIAGSIYFIVEGVKVHKIFAESIVGRLVKTLVIVLLIELYSLGLVSFAFVSFYPKGIIFILPIIFLWIISLIYAIFAIKSTKKEVVSLTNK
ncbi:MAG: hypothetical protein AAB410_03650 [Patescibacteria group bacterium]